MSQNKDIADKSERLKDYLPITLFVVLTFLLEAFGLSKATNLVVSVFISLFTFGVLSAMLREKYGERVELKPLQNKTGLLTAMYLPIIAVAFLHWYQIWHVNLRWGLFFVLLVLYFFLLFRAVSTLHSVKSQLTKGKK